MWPLEYRELKLIEDLLVCSICYEYMNTSVITSCSHNYCSLCIRKYLHHKTQCPVCLAETFEKDLRKNRVLDEIITNFSHVKKKLQRCLQGQVPSFGNKKDDGTPPKLKNTEKSESNSPSITQEIKVLDGPIISKYSVSPSVTKTVQKDLSSPSTSGKPKIALIFTPKSKKDVPNLEETKTVLCPVCKVTISEAHINRHLDDCLKREAKKDRPQMVEQKRKPLPKLVFSLMKDSVIRKKLKELGLTSQGDRKTLENRLQRYIVLYNAECDKLDPRPVSELIKICEDEENLEKRANKLTPSANRFQVNRNTEQNVIDDERKKYLEAHKDSFESLIAQIKSTKTPKKPPVRRSLLDESANLNTGTPRKRQAVLQNSIDATDETDSNDFQPIIYDDLDIQASDSDTSCPLQTYSSTDPMKCVSADLFSPDTERVAQDRSTPDNKTRTSQKSMDIEFPVKVESDCTDSLIATPLNVNMILKKERELIAEAACEEGTWKHDSREICSTPKSKMSLKRRVKACQNDVRKVELTKDIESSREVKREEMERESITPVLQDLVCDLSSNDSFDCKYNNDRRYAGEDKFANESVTVFSNLEKENISSSSECSENRAIRKRAHDSIQGNGKVVSSAKKKLKASSKHRLNETEELNHEESVPAVLNDNENGRLRKTTRLKKQDSNVSNTESVTALRKSSRTRFKNNILLK